ncbi:MAG: class A beta-lactamase, partial [Opitutaceae bacterium]
GPMSARSISRLLCCGIVFPILHLRGADQSSPTKALAEQRIKAIETRLGWRLGVAALDTGSGRRIEHRASERFPMCSTFKFLAAAAVLHRVDEKKEQLSRFIPYTEADLLEYAPVTKKHVGAGGLPLDALCAAAIELSDNTAGNLLLQTIGGPEGFTRYARSLGDEKTRLNRIEPDLNSAQPGDERDTTSPGAMVENLRSLLVGDALSKSSRQLLEEWLIANTTGGETIRAGVPNDWKVGDKTGRGSNGATNDVALLRPPGRPPIILAVYAVGSSAPRQELQNAIAEVARITAETF